MQPFDEFSSLGVVQAVKMTTSDVPSFPVRDKAFKRFKPQGPMGHQVILVEGPGCSCRWP